MTHPESPSPAEPLSQRTKEQFIAEVFGLLGKQHYVSLEHGEKGIDICNSPDDTVIVSEEIDGGTRETRFSIIGSGRDAEVTIMESVTAEGDVVDTAEADQIQTALGMGRRPADESEITNVLRLIREAEEIGRSER